MSEVQFKLVKVEKPTDVNVILGQSHFIKTVEDLYEAIVGTV
ncbi:MAG: adenosine-specific kinase, partial [Candidatus Bathyarchaeia archaeon]